jgi:hypothetical protein
MYKKRSVGFTQCHVKFVGRILIPPIHFTVLGIVYCWIYPVLTGSIFDFTLNQAIWGQLLLPTIIYSDIAM